MFKKVSELGSKSGQPFRPPLRTSSNSAKIHRMKKKSLTLKELEEGSWWWKCKENRAEMERLKIYGFELAARNYELMRRCPNVSEFERTYLKLDRENKTTTIVAWANPNEFPYRQIFDLQKQEEIGWTSVRQHFQWNLRLSDRILTEAFLEYINLHRNVQKIPRNSSLKGKKNRPPSWLYVECLDRKRNKIGGYDTGIASKAEKMAIQFLAEFKRAQVKRDEIAKKWGLVFDDLFDDSEELS